MSLFDTTAPCPCGTGRRYAACCGPFLAGAARPDTVEAVLRSRYTAFTRGDEDHLFRTWHPGTRPATIALDPQLTWTGLEVREVVEGGPTDDTGEATFAARFRTDLGEDVLVERSSFVRRAGRWVYVDGVRLE